MIHILNKAIELFKDADKKVISLQKAKKMVLNIKLNEKRAGWDNSLYDRCRKRRIEAHLEVIENEIAMAEELLDAYVVENKCHELRIYVDNVMKSKGVK